MICPARPRQPGVTVTVTVTVTATVTPRVRVPATLAVGLSRVGTLSAGPHRLLAACGKSLTDSDSECQPESRGGTVTGPLASTGPCPARQSRSLLTVTARRRARY